MLIFVCSFDHFSAAQATRKWTGFAGGIGAGRTNNCATGGNMSLGKTFDTEYAAMTMGIAYKTAEFSNGPLRFLNVLNDLSTSIRHVGDGRLRFHYNPPNAFGSAITSFVMSTGVWYYLEMATSLALTGTPGGAGTLTFTNECYVNGALVLSETYPVAVAYDAWTAHGKFAGISCEGAGGGATSWVDDLYLTDGERLGDIRIGVLYPNAAGDSAAWTPTPAGNNWQQVEEHPADDDTSYVSAATVGLKDLYNLDDIDPAFTGDIKGVQALWLVRKSDEGAGAVKGVWKSGATEITQASGHNYLAPNGFYPSATSYLYDIQTERNSLFTAADWSTSEINSLQMGLIRTL